MVNNIRDYEVSIWTLQDSFITVLKPFKVESKGKIQEAKMILKDDGENTLSFKIPMYILENNTWKENPIWYNTINGNIIANMRKIKVIFNKREESERVFEFIILKVTEEHEGKSKFCTVECEGLAFHELGKQGYNITLSADDAYLEYEEYINSENTETNNNSDTEQISYNDIKYINSVGLNNFLTIDYWVKKVLKGTKWEYEIQMDWSMLPVQNNSAPDSKKIYRNPYPTSWNTGNLVTATNYVTNLNELEFKACVDKSESNRYNLLQAIAEAFQVFCKFVYEYDDNYHIIGRKVIFYNNFIKESEGFLDFNYGYNTQNISREMDSNDLVSKMYVKPLKDSGVLTGEVYLSDSLINKSLENYLLNFDYLYNIGTITQEQYDEVESYISEIRKLNNDINNSNSIINKYEQDLPKIRATKKNAEDNLNEDIARITEAGKYLEGIVGNSTLKYSNDNKYNFTVIKNSNNNNNNNTYYSSISFKGIIGKTLHLYNPMTNDEITTYNIEENNGEIVKIKYLDSRQLKDTNNENITSYVQATFEYDPQSPYKWAQEFYEKKRQKDKTIFDKMVKKENLINKRLNSLKDTRDKAIINKQELIEKFEQLMGPALREGVWQPEDEYADYQKIKQFSIFNILQTSRQRGNNEIDFIWDTNILEDELSNIFKSSINQIYDDFYPYIPLTNELLSQIQNMDNLYFVYEILPDNYSNSGDKQRYTHYLPLGNEDGGVYVFLKDGTSNDELKPCLPAILLTGLRDKNITFTNPRISRVTGYNDINDEIVEEVLILKQNSNSDPQEVTFSIVTQSSNFKQIVYPRIRIYNQFFLQNNINNKIYCGGTLLKENEDYYISYQAEIIKDNNNQEDIISYAWYITLKPESIIKNYYNFNISQIQVFYTISTAADAMYLDALQVMRENAFPKVSYSITPLAIDTDFMKNAYNRLGQLAHINDIELKFENVSGYISEVTLDLDKPWEDEYVVKNYKTKFEDLFSSIVAETESMKKNSSVMNMASSLITSEGLLNQDALAKSLLNGDIQTLIEEFSASRKTAIDLETEGATSANLIAKIMNGELGLNYSSTENIERVILNNQNGLIIQGLQIWDGEDEHGDAIKVRQHAFFQVNHEKMGFFHLDSNKNPVSDLYYNKGNLTLNGDIYATGGKIGGWYITSKGIENIPTGQSTGNPYPNYSAGMRWTDTTDINHPIAYAFWAGSQYTGGKWVVPFYVTQDGSIHATKGKIADWYIQESGIENIPAGQTTGEDQINGTINPDYSAGFRPGTVADSSGSDDKNGPKYALWVGSQYDHDKQKWNNPFYVTQNGSLYASQGMIGGWAIDGNGLYKNDDEHPGYSFAPMGLSATGSQAFWAGGYKVDPNDVHSEWVYKFNVNRDGILHATGAYISGTVDVSGVIRASSGNIGDWYIQGSGIESLPTGTITTQPPENVSKYSAGLRATIPENGSKNDVAFWIGSYFVQEKNENGTLKTDSEHNPVGDWIYPFRVNYDGKLVATGAEITGKITATDGKIGGWYIREGGIENIFPGEITGEHGNPDYSAGFRTGNDKTGDTNVENPGFVFWAGSQYIKEKDGSGNVIKEYWDNPFYVTQEGDIHAKKLFINRVSDWVNNVPQYNEEINVAEELGKLFGEKGRTLNNEENVVPENEEYANRGLYIVVGYKRKSYIVLRKAEDGEDIVVKL